MYVITFIEQMPGYGKYKFFIKEIFSDDIFSIADYPTALKYKTKQEAEKVIKKLKSSKNILVREKSYKAENIFKIANEQMETKKQLIKQMEKEIQQSKK